MTVNFPQAGGTRPTSQPLRQILADATATATPELSERIRHTRAWCTDYAHLLAESTSSTATATLARTVATDGLASARRNLVWTNGSDVPLGEVDLRDGANGVAEPSLSGARPTNPNRCWGWLRYSAWPIRLAAEVSPSRPATTQNLRLNRDAARRFGGQPAR